MTPEILRIWRGRIRPADAGEYEQYSSATAFPHMTGVDGNRGLYLARRELTTEGAEEFASFSLWSSWDAVRRFAGDTHDQAVDLPEDERFLVDQWKSMENYEIFRSVPIADAGDKARIVRVWRGATRRSDGDAYEDYLGRTGFAEYSATEGNQGVYMARRDGGDQARICCVTLWESMDAVRAFAGDDPERAVFYPEDKRFLVDRELTVAHYTVYSST
jgi:heme-degrading monooxygenase HmoA